MDFGATLLAIFLGGFVKGAVMVVSIWMFWRFHQALAAGGRSAPLRISLTAGPSGVFPEETRWLWWGLLMMVASEVVCAVEVYILLHAYWPISIVHSFTSALTVGFLMIGIFLHFDRTTLHMFHDDKPCLGLQHCQGCPLRATGRCKFDRLFSMLIILVAASIIPLLLSSQAPQGTDTSRFAFPFDSWNRFFEQSIEPLILQVNSSYERGGKAYTRNPNLIYFETHIGSWVALMMLAGSFALLQTRRRLASLKWMLVATGFIAFGYFETVTNSVTRDILWGGYLHEFTEIWTLLMLLELLRRLYPAKAAPA